MSKEQANLSGLHNVLGALLVSINEAQHISNLHSQRLAEYYRKDPILARFPVPNAVIRSFDFHLRMALGDLTNSNGPEDVHQRLNWAGLTSFFATQVFDTMEGILNQTHPPDAQDLQTILTDIVIHQGLSQSLSNALSDQFSELGDLEDPKTLQKVAMKFLVGLAEGQGFPLPSKMKKELKASLTSLTAEWPAMIRKYTDQQAPSLSFPVLTGQIESRTLSSLEEGLEMDLKVEVRDFRWFVDYKESNGVRIRVDHLEQDSR